MSRPFGPRPPHRRGPRPPPWGMPPVAPEPYPPAPPGRSADRPIFDWTSYSIQEVFKQVTRTDDTNLRELLIRKVKEMVPSHEEMAPVLAFYDRIYNTLEYLQRRDTHELQIQDIIMIGSFLKGTHMVGHLVGDLVVAFAEMPTAEMLSKVVDRLEDTYNKREFTTGDGNSPSGSHQTKHAVEDQIYYDNLSAHSATIHSSSGHTIIIHSTASSAVIYKAADLNPAYIKPFADTLSAIRHAGWFQQNTRGIHDLQDLVRIVKDICHRFEGLSHLNVWHIELLCHCACLSLSGGDSLSLTPSFRRVFELLSCGIFLPGTLSIPDPCEDDDCGIQVLYSPEQQDEITRTAQTILRLIGHGAIKEILGLDGQEVPDLSEEVHVNGITLRPPVPVVPLEGDTTNMEAQA